MKNGRNPEFDLEKRRPAIMLFSFVLPLALTLVAFEWTTRDAIPKYKFSALPDDLFIEEELIPISPRYPEPPKPMAARSATAPATVIQIITEPLVSDPVGPIVATDPIDPFISTLPPRQEIVDEDKLFEFGVEQMPRFQGGDAGLFKYLGKNIRYPEIARDAGIQGIVYIRFEVDKDGKVKDARVLRGIGGGCDEEALRVVKAMPTWEPGRQRGEPVRVQYTLPVRFVLKN